MPLRDHFHPPVSKQASWEGLHGGWPMMMVQQLSRILPDGFSAEPRVHLGDAFELDVSTYEDAVSEHSSDESPHEGVAVWAPPAPTLTLKGDLFEPNEYEVLIFDYRRQRRLVAAVEIVSPANKDRPSTRQAFVAKCAALLHRRICVSIVDVVTARNFNLYAELLGLTDNTDPSLGAQPTATYAVTCRNRTAEKSSLLETWAYPLIVGKPLPAIPIWLDEDKAVSLDLEQSYEETCRALRIR